MSKVITPYVRVDDMFANLLIALPTWVGDFVMATPALRAIRNRFREAKITFLMEPNLRDLVRGGNWMDECIEWPEKRRRSIFSSEFRKFIRELRARKFDCAILLPNSFRSALAVWSARIPRRVGYDRDGRGWLLTDRVPVKNRRRSIYHIHGDLRASHGQNCGHAPPYDTASPLSKGGPRGVEAVHQDAPYKNDGHGTPYASPLSKGGHRGVEAVHQDAPYKSVPLRWHADCKCATRRFSPHAPVIVGRHLPKSPGAFIPMPMVEYYADLVKAIGCERPGDSLELFTMPDADAAVESRLRSIGIEDKHPLVVLSPGAKFGASKCWPADRFAAAANRLIEQDGATVLVTCGPGEEPIAQTILGGIRNCGYIFGSDGGNFIRAGSVSARPDIDPSLTLRALKNIPGLGQLKSLIHRCDLLICNDAGPRHFAKAFNVPVVTIFGPTHPDWTATSYEDERIVRVNVDCGPCQQKICPLGHHRCMTDVTVDMVVEAARDLLASRRLTGAAR